MPPKVKITKEMIIDAAFEIARSEGAENINARAVSKKLGCSTQPVMYHFKTILLPPVTGILFLQPRNRLPLIRRRKQTDSEENSGLFSSVS